MSRERDLDNELLDAATEIALKLGFVEMDPDDAMVDAGSFDEDKARELIQQLIDREDELVEPFDDDLESAVKYVEQVVKDTSDSED